MTDPTASCHRVKGQQDTESERALESDLRMIEQVTVYPVTDWLRVRYVYRESRWYRGNFVLVVKQQGFFIEGGM